MINAYCTDTITVLGRTPDKWGVMTSVSTVVKGRFEFKTRMIRNLQGEMVVSSARVTLPKTTVIDHNSRISCSYGEYSVLGIEILRDFSSRFIRVNLQ